MGLIHKAEIPLDLPQDHKVIGIQKDKKNALPISKQNKTNRFTKAEIPLDLPQGGREIEIQKQKNTPSQDHRGKHYVNFIMFYCHYNIILICNGKLLQFNKE